MTADPGGRFAEPQRWHTAARIHRGAIDLIREHGYDPLTVDHICARAGVSTQAFFEYFPDRESAVLGRFSAPTDVAMARFRFGIGSCDLFVDLADLLVSQIASEGRDEADLQTIARAVQDKAPLLNRLVHELSAVEDQMAGLIGSRLGLHCESRRVRVLAAVFMAAVRVAVQRWAHWPERGGLYNEICSCGEELDNLARGYR